MIQSFKDAFDESGRVLNEFIQNPENFNQLEEAGNIMVNSLNASGKIISCGNGGSLSDAMHFAEELTGHFRDSRPAYPAVAISDPSHITCVANDFGYEYIFSRYVDAFAQKQDTLLAISTSGNSPNVVNAVKSAKSKGAKVVALTGKDGGVLADMADAEIRVPANYADKIQEIHIKAIHTLIAYIEQNIKGE